MKPHSRLRRVLLLTVVAVGLHTRGSMAAPKSSSSSLSSTTTSVDSSLPSPSPSLSSATRVTPPPPPSAPSTPPAATGLPTVVGNMAYASDGTRLIIQGGHFNQIDSFQAFSLSLNTSWTAESPRWTDLQFDRKFSGRAATFLAGAGGNITGGGLFLATGIEESSFEQFYVYSTTTGSWTLQNSPARPITITWPALIADPTNRVVYFLGTDGSASSAIFSSAELDGWQQQDLPPPPLTPISQGQAGSWSVQEKAILSTVEENGKMELQKYLPQAPSNWVSLGTAASLTIAPRKGHCFVPNDSGSHYYLYGGSSGNDALDDLFELNLAARSWKQLASSGTRSSMMACAVSGTMLVVWGGFADGSARAAVQNNRPLVFDINANKWVDSYFPTHNLAGSPSDPQHPSVGSAGPASGSSSSSESNVGAIAGGIVGGLAVIALVAGFFVLSKRRNRRPTMSDDETVYKASRSSKHDSEGHHESLDMGNRYTSIPSPFEATDEQPPQADLTPPLPLAQTLPQYRQTPPPIPSRPTSIIQPQSQSPASAGPPLQPPHFIQSPFEVDTEPTSQHQLYQSNQWQPPPPPVFVSSQPSTPVPMPSDYHDRGGDKQELESSIEPALIPRSLEPATVDLIPISGSEIGDDDTSQVSRSNSMVSNKGPVVGRNMSRGTTVGEARSNVDDVGDGRRNSSESLRYLDIAP